MRNHITCLALLALTACGTQSEEKPQATTQDAPAGLPQAAVIAVPVDASGKEDSSKAEMRLLPQSSADAAGQGIATAYEQGKQPDRVVSELDATSSTQSFRGWFGYQNYGQGYGYNFYGQNFGCRSYQTFQPTYYYGGNPYSWQYQNNFQTTNMNYYYYNRPQTFGQFPQQGHFQNNQFGNGQYSGNQFSSPAQPIGYRY
jgi:hypothetical protein